MEKLLHILFEVYSNVNSEIDEESFKEMEMSRENGIDSLTFVKLIMAVEEEYDIELDDYMESLLQTNKIIEFAGIINDYICNLNNES